MFYHLYPSCKYDLCPIPKNVIITITLKTNSQQQIKLSGEPLLPFVSNKDLYHHVQKVLETAQEAVDLAEENLYSNVIDPFSALFDSFRQGIKLSDWMEQEKTRQIQKTMQNALGNFHQGLLGSVPGWESLPTGNVIDVRNMKKQVMAEIKNKYNTTKGSDKKGIYDNLLSQLEGDYQSFIGYYVEVIPKNKKPYNKTFTPSDNVTGTRRPANEKIRIIDGKSFYALVAGRDDALKMLYTVLPKVIGDILGKDHKTVIKEKLFMDLFEMAY